MPVEYLEMRRQMSPKLGLSGCFVSALFEMYNVEGICGRFGRIGVATDTYRALRGVGCKADRPMIELKASRFVGSGYFGNLST